MKLLLLTLFALFVSNLNAQITKVIYKFEFYNAELSTKELVENKYNMPEYALEIVKKGFNEMFEQQFELLFDKSTALYFEINLISTGKFAIDNDDNIYYKNLKSKEKIFQNKITGSKVNVFIPFNQYDWQISDESKIISGYKCFKAILKTSTYNPLTKQQISTNRFAWFTPEIPASFGPEGFDGLPGLVLETAENDKICLRAVKIEFDMNKNIKIEKPTASKTITLEEYETIEKANFKKMQDEMGN